MKQTFSHTLTFYLIATLVVLFIAVSARCADAQELKDWGQYEIGERAMVVNVREALTSEKTGFGNPVTQDGFKKFSANATESAKKMLRKLWDTAGVSDLRFSTYTVIVFKANMYTWDELEQPVNTIFEEWYSSVNR